MSLPDNWHRNPELFAEELRKFPSIRAMADQHGVSRSNMMDWAKKHGIKPPARPKAQAAPRSLSEPVSSEELLKVEVKELRSQVAGVREQQVAQQVLCDLLTSAIDSKVPRYKRAARQKDNKGPTTHRFFLEWSDLHAAEIVSGEEMNGVNAYDWNVMLRRHQAMQEAVISFREHRPYPVDKLYIGALGDMVTGDIHDELRETNEKVLSEATVQLGLDMADWIENFIPEFHKIQIDGIVGNHGRRSKKPKAKQAFDNFDWIFYQILKQRLAKYPSVTVNVPKSAMTPITIFNKRILLWHGDGVRSTMPGVPWGGYMRRIKELDATYSAMGLPIDHYAVGHMHEPNVIANGKILMNGSVKGPDEYSLRAFGGGAPASQNLFTFHPRRGLTDWSRLELQGVS